MTRKIEYETLDEDLNPGWKWVLEWFKKIYVKRSFTIDAPNSDILFKIIDVLSEWYLELRLRKLERLDDVDDLDIATFTTTTTIPDKSTFKLCDIK